MHKNLPPKGRCLDRMTSRLHLDNWLDVLDDWWSVECRRQVSTVDYVYNTKRRPLFIAAEGHAETQRISEYWDSRVVL